MPLRDTPMKPTEVAYTEFQAAYDHYNAALFDSTLKPCLISIQRQASSYGYYSRNRFVHRDGSSMTDEIALNPEYFGVVPLLEILQTLVHEMAHAWQHQKGTPSRRAYHNLEWANKMEAIGLMPSVTGQPGGRRTGEKMADYMIQGGRFHVATKALLATGFQVSWHDRRTAKTVIAPPYSAALDVQTLSPQDEGHETLQADEIALWEAAVEIPRPPTPTAEAPDPPPPPVSKHKFCCPEPGCKTSAWGKASLRIACANHENFVLMQLQQRGKG